MEGGGGTIEVLVVRSSGDKEVSGISRGVPEEAGQDGQSKVVAKDTGQVDKDVVGVEEGVNKEEAHARVSISCIYFNSPLVRSPKGFREEES